MPPLTDDSLEGKLKLGAILMITMRWAVRLMGLVSMVILARLLTPEDFGIVAMAMVFQALMEGLVNLNVELAIIRNQQAEKAHYDSAWTLGLVQFAVIGAILASLAGYAAEFYDEPRLEAVIWVAALALFVRGWVNIGVVDFRKDLNFRLDLKYNLAVNAVRVVCTIGLAFLLRSYWAMVLGILAGSIAAVVISYAMSPRRPRPSFERTREILSFSAGVWLVNLNSFFSRQADRLIMGRLLPMGALGGYSVAIDLARLPSAELILPMSRALVPGYAKVKHDVERMARLFKALLGAVAVLSAPIAFGFPLIAGDFTFVVLGEKWTFIVPMLQIAAVLAVIELVAGCNRPLLLAAGSMMMLNIVLTLETIIGLSAIYPAYLWRQEEGVLLTFTAVRCAVLLGLLGLSAVTLRVRFGELLQSFLRPFLAGAVMAAGVWSAHLPDLNPWLRLPWLLGVGGLLYAVALFGIWHLCGRPNGIERSVIDHVGGLIAKRRAA